MRYLGTWIGELRAIHCLTAPQRSQGEKWGQAKDYDCILRASKSREIQPLTVEMRRGADVHIDVTLALSHFAGSLPIFVAVILAWLQTNTRIGDLRGDISEMASI